MKLPFPVYREPDTYIRKVSPAGRPAFHHLRICQYVFAIYTSYSVLGLRSVMTTALDSDERLHSEVGLKQERESTTDLDIVQSACLWTEEPFETEKATREGVEER